MKQTNLWFGTGYRIHRCENTKSRSSPNERDSESRSRPVKGVPIYGVTTMDVHSILLLTD